MQSLFPKNRRVWDVVYKVTRLNERAATAQINLAKAKKRLESALWNALAFAERAKLQDWKNIFKDVLAYSEGHRTEIPYHPDLLPARGYGAAVKHVIAFASKAWVFGGMGSWNDMSFSEGSLKGQYDETTQALYEAVVHALVDATNSYGF